MLRFEIFNIEIMQHVFVVKYICCYIIGTNLSLEYGGILDLTDLWWRILPKLMPSRLLLANDSFRKERLSISYFLMLTGLKSLWPVISKTITVDLYSFEIGFVTWFTKHKLYKACSFKRGSENSFERMWSIPNGFCINGRLLFSETSWSIGDVYWRWPWFRLRRGEVLKISITFTDIQVGLDRMPMP